MEVKKTMRVCYSLAILAFALCLFAQTAEGQSAESFFKGKVIRLIAGSSPGGGTDSLARLLARHYGRHIPGNPRIIVANMPGAGGMIAANFLWNRAKRDGLTFGSMNSGLIYRVATGGKGMKFKLDKFIYLGAVASEANMVYLRSDRPYTSFEAIKNASRKPKMGAQSKSHSSNVTLKVIEQVLEGVKFDVVYGYPGTAEILLDIERGALDGRSHSIGSFLATRGDWVKKGFVRVLAVSSRERDARLPKVPTLHELAPPSKRGLLAGLYAVADRTYALPPGLPPGRAKVLRDSYAAMLNDPKFIKDGKGMGWNIVLKRGEQLNREFTALFKNKKIMDLYRKALGK